MGCFNIASRATNRARVNDTVVMSDKGMKSLRAGGKRCNSDGCLSALDFVFIMSLDEQLQQYTQILFI